MILTLSAMELFRAGTTPGKDKENRNVVKTRPGFRAGFRIEATAERNIRFSLKGKDLFQ